MNPAEASLRRVRREVALPESAAYRTRPIADTRPLCLLALPEVSIPQVRCDECPHHNVLLHAGSSRPRAQLAFHESSSGSSRLARGLPRAAPDLSHFSTRPKNDGWL